jgi:serine/threonine protein phosphatase PrpC
MRYETAAFTDKGGKAVNEDTVEIKNGADFLITVLADGLGSHGGGDIASKTTADVLSRDITDLSEECVFKAIERANTEVIAKQKPGCEMKSTAVLVAVGESEAIISNVGDSRGYHLSDGKIVFQTFDHSIPALEMLRGNITADEIRFHPARNKLLRAVGTMMCKPDFERRNVKTGDGFLLCSAGFWEYVTEAEIEEDFGKSKTAEQWLELLLERIRPRFTEGHDNYSAVTVLIY